MSVHRQRIRVDADDDQRAEFSCVDDEDRSEDRSQLNTVVDS